LLEPKQRKRLITIAAAFLAAIALYIAYQQGMIVDVYNWLRSRASGNQPEKVQAVKDSNGVVPDTVVQAASAATNPQAGIQILLGISPITSGPQGVLNYEQSMSNPQAAALAEWEYYIINTTGVSPTAGQIAAQELAIANAYA